MHRVRSSDKALEQRKAQLLLERHILGSKRGVLSSEPFILLFQRLTLAFESLDIGANPRIKLFAFRLGQRHGDNSSISEFPCIVL